MDHGIFTASLDFELYWGVRDKKSIDQYKENLLGARKAIPEILQDFTSKNIHATWATVGFLFFKDKESLTKRLPKQLPTYNEANLSPYTYINNTAILEESYHFAPKLINLIAEHPGQEIGTHTFSHYCCLEKGQTIEQFEDDIHAAIEIAESSGFKMQSIVFPRNQSNKDYFSSLIKLGIKCYRGNEKFWIYGAIEDTHDTKLQQALRLLDAYINISGHNTYELADCIQSLPFNFPSSRFLRPYSSKLSALDWLRLRRIKSAMTDAAINHRIFHLWWHPHNFGKNTKKNIEFLSKISDHYLFLKERHGMKSLNMGELCQLGEAHNNQKTHQYSDTKSMPPRLRSTNLDHQTKSFTHSEGN
jgi:peptidoglycan/xylan/chitin deacetylase (PgdA/CDA1 family)